MIHICNIFILLVLIKLFVVFAYKVKDGPLLTSRPPWMIICRRTDPNLNNCANTLFANIFPELAVGIPYMNVDAFEPLPLDIVSISKGNGPITLAGSLFNLNVAGPSNATPTFSVLDLKNKKWNFGLEIPLLDIKSTYNLKGRILVLPLVGHGASELKLKDVKTKVSSDISFIQKEGREIIHIDNMKLRFTVGHMRVNLENLFNGNKILGQTVNAFINSNYAEVIKELEESIAESLANIFTDLMNNVYSKMPTDLWLLTDEQYEKYKSQESVNQTASTISEKEENKSDKDNYNKMKLSDFLLTLSQNKKA